MISVDSILKLAHNPEDAEQLEKIRKNNHHANKLNSAIFQCSTENQIPCL